MFLIPVKSLSVVNIQCVDVCVCWCVDVFLCCVFASLSDEYWLGCLFECQVMEVINEEERQFLKTLSRGKRLFERTVNQLPGEVIPGDV